MFCCLTDFIRFAVCHRVDIGSASVHFLDCCAKVTSSSVRLFYLIWHQYFCSACSYMEAKVEQLERD